MDVEKPPIIGRIVALFEVLLCSDFPTQLAIGQTLIAFGMRPLSLKFIVTLSLIDTPLLIALIFLFLRSHGERVRPVLWGSRSAMREVRLGLPLTVGAFVIAIAAIGLVRILAPVLHNVPQNPLQNLIHGRGDVALF